MTTTPDEPLPLPEEGPATLLGVKSQPTVGAGVDDADLQPYVDAVNTQVRGWPIADASRGATEWPATVVLGAQMLAGRLWRRRNTLGGVEVFGDGGIAYVRRNDPDIAMLLQIGDYGKPATA